MSYMFIFSIFIPILSIMLILFIYYRLIDINKFFKNTYYKRTSEGFNDLLQYDTLIEDDIILLKNGSLLTVLSYEGTDLSQISQVEQERMTELISKAIFELGTGWVINFDAVRLETEKYSNRAFSAFKNKISYAIDEERRELFNSKSTMFTTGNFITVTYTPPLIMQTKFIDSMYTKSEDNKTISVAEKNLIHFKTKLDNFLSTLSSVLKIVKLGNISEIDEFGNTIKHNELLEFLHYCITGKSQDINIPKSPINIDLLIGGEDFYTGIIPKVGNNYISCIAIDGFPAESYPSILSRLSDIPINSRFSTRFICIDKMEAETKLKKIKSKWTQSQRGILTVVFNQKETSSNINHDAVEMTQDAIEGITLQQSDRAIFGYYTANIILMEESQEILKEYSLKIKKIMTGLGFNARIETINAVEAFIGSIPGHNLENIRRFFIHSINLGDLIPKNTIWTGREYAPCDFYPKQSPALMECVTTGNTPYHFNLHVADVGHTLVAGPTGAGKSTFLATVVAQAFRYQEATVFVFDKGMSMFALNQALGGLHFELAADDCDLVFNPFQYIDSQEDRLWLVGFVEGILSLNSVNVTPAVSKSIYTAVNHLYQLKLENPSFIPNITDFKSQLQYAEINLQDIIDLYDIAGAYTGYFSGDKDNLSLSNFVVFEIEHLMNLDDKILLPVLDYLFRRIDKQLQGQPAFVVLDEAWVAFKNPVFSSKIIEWLKVFRKRNCAVILATQNLMDASNNSENLLSELIISTASKVFLPNAAATKSEFAAIYKKFGLNDEQIKIIAQAVPKKHYYHYTSEGARLFELALGKLALAFVAVSSPPEIKEIKSLISVYKENWVDEYLKLKNININNYLEYYSGS